MTVPSLLLTSFVLISAGPGRQALCTSQADCPAEAVCEDGVCVVATAPAETPETAPGEARESTPTEAREPAPPAPPPKVKRLPPALSGQVVKGETCRRHHECKSGLVCFKKKCSERPPSTGTAMIVIGAIGTGLGALNLATSPICVTDFYKDSVGNTGSNVCLTLSLAVAGIGLGVGIPLLIVGLNEKSKYKEWIQEHRPDLAYQPLPGGGGQVLVGARF